MDGDESVTDDAEVAREASGDAEGGERADANPGATRNMFELSEEDERAMAREARKRAAIWGFGTGIAMLVVAGLCLVLAILLANSTN